jgi:RNA polymerase sigma-70 factor (ECF subfamily)
MTASSNDSDHALLARLARSRDPRAFETLYRRHTDMLYATAVRITRDPDVAADVVHDAWVRAAEQAGRFEARSAVRTWIVGIVMNLIRERARDARRNGERAPHAADEPDDADAHWSAAASATPPPGIDVAGIDPMDLDAAIAALPEGFRQVLVLHDVEGFTHEEIAAMTGIVPGTSKSQLARARQRVRAMLTNGEPSRRP